MKWPRRNEQTFGCTVSQKDYYFLFFFTNNCISHQKSWPKILMAENGLLDIWDGFERMRWKK